MQELVEYYFNTDVMKAYYDQRRDDYYDGAGNTSPGIGDYDGSSMMAQQNMN